MLDTNGILGTGRREFGHGSTLHRSTCLSWRHADHLHLLLRAGNLWRGLEIDGHTLACGL